MRNLFSVCLVLLLSPTALSADEPEAETVVSVPDERLRKVIVAQFARRNIEADILTPELMSKVYFLKAADQGISSLQGLEFCENLREVHLPDNRIADLLPLASCVKITSLDLSNNKISNVSPLSKLTELRALNVDHNQIEELALGRLTKLGLLHVSHNRLKNLKGIDSPKALHSLYAADNQIEDISSTANMAKLSSLDLRNNVIAKLGPLEKLMQLRWTFLSNNQVTDLGVLVRMAEADQRRQFAPFWRVVVDENPLSSQTAQQLQSLREAGVTISARQSSPQPDSAKDVSSTETDAEPIDLED